MIFLSLFFTSCENEDAVAENCLDYKHARITQVDLEEFNVEKNFDLPIQLKYEVVNSCGDFYDFEVERNDKIYDIKVKTKYEGCECNEMLGEKNIVYYFRATETGTYTLNFSVSTTEYITKIVTVN